MLNDSATSYSLYLQNVLTVFMILFGINFNVYFLIISGRIIQGLKSEEMRCYLGIIAAAIVVITINISSAYESIGMALQHVSFQVASIITMTGFAT